MSQDKILGLLTEMLQTEKQHDVGSVEEAIKVIKDDYTRLDEVRKCMITLLKALPHVEGLADQLHILVEAWNRNEEALAKSRDDALVESNSNAQVQLTFPIAKADKDKRLVTGIVLEPDAVDAHGDYQKVETIQVAAHSFLNKFNQFTRLGLDHRIFGQIGVNLVESWIAPEDMTMGGVSVSKGSWIMTVKVEDDGLWAKVKTGEITGFSIGAMALVGP